ncbi:MAG: oligosaccharide repeat unit polymerase [Bacteroidales bacterium]|nr:oligosaccharide repeat unit polymerase [Bacteroidales bacterium]
MDSSSEKISLKQLKIIVKKDFIITILLLIAVSFVLEYYYKSYVAHYYQNLGVVLKLNIVKYVESKLWFIFLILTSYFLYKRSKFIYALYIFLLVLVFIPGHIMFSYSDGSRLVFYSVITFFIIFAVFSTIKFKIKTIYLGETEKYYFLIFFSVILLIPVIADFKFNINTNVFSLKDVYDVREVYKENTSFFTSYFFNWLAKIAVPVILVFSLIRKNYLFVLFSLLVLIYLFLVSGHKSVYFTPVVIFFYYIFGKKYNDKIKLTLGFLLALLILVSIPDYFLNNNNMFKSIFVRRVFFVPSLLNEFYFDFYKDSHLYLSHSIFSSFADYRYDMSPAHTIADVYFHKPLMNANNGIISDGFMNFGFLGVILYSLIFSFIFALLNSIKLNPKYFGLFIFYMLTFVSSALLTVILTHGFFLVLIFAFIIFPEKKL